MVIYIYLILFLLFSSCTYAKSFTAHLKKVEKKEKVKEATPPPVGNFSMSATQVPGPLVSFGENIIEKGKVQILLPFDEFSGPQKKSVDILPTILYGLTPRLSVFYSLPIAAYFKDGAQHSSGLEDSLLQFEYAYYVRSTTTYSDTGTMVAGVTFPTGSAKKQPPTGSGSSNIFLGLTFNRTYTNWFFFASPGTLLSTPHGNNQNGNQYLYQAGFGRNIYVINSKLIIAGVFELDERFRQKVKQKGQLTQIRAVM